MKVSILTYHWEDNYGATLQAYATYKAIEALGHTPEFIDLRLPYNPSLIRRILFSLKRKRFNAFRKKYFKNMTPATYWNVDQLKNVPPESDCYLVGSDQTWNPQIAKALLPAFFLDFGDDKIKRITYATSIGLNEWKESSDFSNDEIRRALQKFDKLLLREDSGIKIAKDIFGADAEQVVDPVLLFPSYPELTGDIQPSNEVIVYKLIDDKDFYLKARNIADGLGLSVRSLGSLRKIKGFQSSYPEKIEDWIKRIASSSLVITDSFHGTVFSLLYHRPFVVYVGNSNKTTRLYSLLSQLGLSNRIITSNNSIDEFINIAETQINWARIDSKLTELRQESIHKLQAAISE